MTLLDDAVETPAAPDTAIAARGGFGAWLTALRPRQWIKNLVVLAGILFTGRIGDPHDALAVLAAFAIFCAISSAGYLVNDLCDAEKDRQHPLKRHRPIAAGRIAPVAAGIVAGLLFAAALGAAWLLSFQFALVALGYLALTLSYTLYWKHLVILDLMAINAGFLLRALAGTVIIGVDLSAWLFVCLFLLALVMGLGKRRHELALLEDDSAHHRPVLDDYSRHFLDQALTMAASATIVSYAVYTISSDTAHAHRWILLTVPLVIYGVLRYLYLIFHHELGGQPEEMLLTDRPLLMTIVLWLGVVVVAFMV